MRGAALREIVSDVGRFDVPRYGTQSRRAPPRALGPWQMGGKGQLGSDWGTSIVRGNLGKNGGSSPMSMVKTLKQIGNSYGVIIDKPILEILHITPETPLEITTDGQSLNIRPVRQRKRPTLNESLAAVNKRHAHTLKKLAK